MITFDDLQDNVVYISYPNGEIFKKQGYTILQLKQFLNDSNWQELSQNLIRDIEDLMFETWKQRFGSEPLTF